MAQVFDVAVLGGGLIGSAMAVSLARHGFQVALVDPAPADVRADPHFDGRAYAVAPGSRNLLDALGIWDQVKAHAQPISHIQVTDRTEGPVANAGMMFTPDEAGREQMGWILEDRYLRPALLAAVASAGVDHRAPAQAESVARGSARADINLADGSDLAARLVVACDGRRSAIARAAGIGYLAWSYYQTGLVSAVSHALPHDGVAHQSFFPGGPFAVLPLPGDRSALVWSERSARARDIAAMSDDAYMAEISARLQGRLGALELAGKRWAYPLNLALAQQFAVPRLVVAGDAAHGVHPIAGQGLNMGLRDIAALTEVLVDAAGLGLDLGQQTVLAGYQHWRRLDATAMSLGMDGLNRLFSTDVAPIQAIRNLGLKAVSHIPAARRFFAEAASGTGEGAPKLLTGQRLD
ncbi:MAG: UbiH/UbiF/VisC/COQ6 family ubiquinone biosynthesis hydroxylase [Pseudomonadota bacterium]